jgi:hypothetical protein
MYMYVNRTKAKLAVNCSIKVYLVCFVFLFETIFNVKSSEIRSQVGRTSRQLLGFVD